MEADDRRRADALDRYWDAALKDPSVPLPDDVDPMVAAIVARLRTRPFAACGDVARQRTRQRLRSAVAAERRRPPPRGTDRFREPSTERRRPRVGRFVAAAGVVLAALAVLAAVLWPFGPTRVPTIPAARPVVAVDTIGTMVVPAEVVPRTADPWIAMGRLVLAPGAQGETDAMSPVGGAGMETVVTGTYVARSGGAMRLARTDGRTLDVPPDTEVTLGPGESILRLDVGATQSWRNPGTTQTVVIGVGLFSTNGAYLARGNPVGGAVGELWASLNGDVWNEAALPAGALRVTIDRVTLAPGAALPAVPNTVPIMWWVVAGTIDWNLFGGGIATPAAGERGTRFFDGQQVPWTVTAPGIRVVLSNPSPSTPTELWAVRIAPAEEAAP